MTTRNDDSTIDMLDAETVEIEIDETGKMWINVDGRCRMRIGKVETIVIDHRSLINPILPRRAQIVNGKASNHIARNLNSWDID